MTTVQETKAADRQESYPHAYGMVHKSALPDCVLYELFDRLLETGRLTETFYDGEVKTHHEFRDFVRRDDIHFWMLRHHDVIGGMC